MARLTLVQKRGKFALSLPHKILIDGHLLGVMKDREGSVEMPAVAYDITVQSMVPMISATQHVELPLRGEVRLEFSDREQVWDALFVVDVVLWVVKRFLHLASPWTWLYEVFTNGYFVLWLIYEWRIRNHYFKFELH